MKKTLIILALAMLLIAGCGRAGKPKHAHDDGHDHEHHQSTLAERKVFVDGLIKETEKNMTMIDILLLGYRVKRTSVMYFDGLETEAMVQMSINAEELYQATPENLKKLNDLSHGIMLYNKKYESTKSGKMTNKLMVGRITLPEAQKLQKEVEELKDFLDKAKANDYNFMFK